MFLIAAKVDVMIQWYQCYDRWTIFSIIQRKWSFLSLRNGIRPIWYFPIALSVSVAFNQHKHNKTKYCIREKSKNLCVLTWLDLQMLLLDVVFWCCLCNN